MSTYQGVCGQTAWPRDRIRGDVQGAAVYPAGWARTGCFHSHVSARLVMAAGVSLAYSGDNAGLTPGGVTTAVSAPRRRRWSQALFQLGPKSSYPHPGAGLVRRSQRRRGGTRPACPG